MELPREGEGENEFQGLRTMGRFTANSKTITKAVTSLGIRAALHCDTRVVSRVLGAFSLDLLLWLNALVWSHLILLLHPWVCQGICSVFVWTRAYSQEREASALAQADREGSRAKTRSGGRTLFQEQCKLNTHRARAVAWPV